MADRSVRTTTQSKATAPRARPKPTQPVDEHSTAKSARNGASQSRSKASAAPRGAAPSKKAASAATGRLIPRAGTVVVRMYRIGHGDCFLLAFPGAKADTPVYVLIDCGYKPGSPQLINEHGGNAPADVAQSIRTATGGHIDIFVITHEHQDHVNAITETNFGDIEIGEAWFAWTEDDSDELANRLRKRFKDRLLGLMLARNTLALSAGGPHQRSVGKIDTLLAMELGGEDDAVIVAGPAMGLVAAEKAIEASANKKAMLLVKSKAKNGVKYLKPHEAMRALPGAKDVRVFALGPPRDEKKITDLDPTETEEFHLRALAEAGVDPRTLDNGDYSLSPFDARYIVKPSKFAVPPPGTVNFFETQYGEVPNADEPFPVCPVPSPTPSPDQGHSDAVPSNADWRRIETDWLMSAEQLALDMNTYTNNGSLVLAFELGKGGKVLLFAADAQRGNWVSWADGTWKDGKEEVTARDLLARTVLLKVGHHGSHNATLNGARESDKPNISWMATESDTAREFSVMITAVRKWAETQKGWDHPYPPIKAALLDKASRRVLQTDTERAAMEAPQMQGGDWSAFQERVADNPLFFDYTVKILAVAVPTSFSMQHIRRKRQ